MRLSLVSLAACMGASVAFAQEGSTVLATADAGAQEQQGPTIELPGLRKLTIGGEYRLRYENRYNYNFNDDVTRHDDFFTQRFRLNLGFEFNDQMSAYVQFQDVRNWGSEVGGTTAAAAPGFDLHQAYVDVKKFPGIGGEARFGRQVLAYGSHRLVGSLEWLSQGRAFDGVRQRWAKKDERQIDAFLTQVRESTDKTTYEDAWFMGTYATWFLEKGAADLYALFRHDNKVAGAGVENRLTVGGRFQKKLGKIDLEAELATQWGEESGADIPIGETYAGHLSARLDLGDDRPPYLFAELDFASGDDPATADNERFDTLYPTAHKHLGMMDFALWENIMHGAIGVGFHPGSKSKLQIAFRYFEAMEEGDVVKGPGGNILSNGGAGVDSEMGSEIDVLYDIKLGTAPVKTSLQVGYGVFLAGQGVLDSMGSDDLAHFGYVQGRAVF